MTVTQFEAALIYDQHYHNSSDFSVPVLVIDVDELEAGICRYENGTLTLAACTDKAKDVEKLRKNAFGLSKYELMPVWKSRMPEINACLEKYYRSAEVINAVAVCVPEKNLELTCSDLKNMFADTRKRLETVFQKTSELLKNSRIDEDHMRILLIGQFAEYVLFQYAAKEYFSFDPFMEDTRFSPYTIAIPSEILIAQAGEIVETQTMVDHDLELLYWKQGSGGRMEKKSLVLLKRNQPLRELEKAQYTDPVYVSAEEALTFVKDGAEKTLGLPYTIPEGSGDLVEVTVVMSESGICIRLRRTDMPSHIYDIDL